VQQFGSISKGMPNPALNPDALTGVGLDPRCTTGAEPSLTGADTGEVAHLQRIRARGPELPVHLVQRARGGLVADGRPRALAADHGAQPKLPHQSRHRAAGHVNTLAVELQPDLVGTMSDVAHAITEAGLSAHRTKEMHLSGSSPSPCTNNSFKPTLILGAA